MILHWHTAQIFQYNFCFQSQLWSIYGIQRLLFSEMRRLGAGGIAERPYDAFCNGGILQLHKPWRGGTYVSWRGNVRGIWWVSNWVPAQLLQFFTAILRLYGILLHYGVGAQKLISTILLEERSLISCADWCKYCQWWSLFAAATLNKHSFEFQN